MKILLFFSFFLITLQSKATVIPVRRASDTTLNAVKHWSQEDFMQRYGTTDSARAMIAYYFDTRKKSQKTMIWSGTATAVSAAGTAIVGSVTNTGTGEPGALRGVILVVVAGSVILTLFSIFGTAFLMKLTVSNKALYKDLLTYHSGKKIHKQYMKTRKFRMFLQAEKASR